MKNLILILSLTILMSCGKEDAEPDYDNSKLVNTYWQANGGFYSLRFSATECTEHVSGMSPIVKPYFLKGDKIYFYSLNNKGYTQIQIISGNTMYWNFRSWNDYDLLYYKK